MNKIVENNVTDIHDLYRIKYRYDFSSRISIDDATFMDFDIKDMLYEHILREFKIELYSRIYKENKVEVLIKAQQGKI